jgi:hypothetical protein
MPAAALEMLPQTQARLVVEVFPARLRAAEGLDVPLDLDAFGGEEALLLGDEIVQAHALGRDADFAHGSSFGELWRPL